MDIQETSLDYDDKNKKIFYNLKKELSEHNKRFKRAVEDADSRIKISQLVSSSNIHGKEKLIEMNNKTDDVVYQQFNKLDEAQRNILDIEGRGNSISRELNNQTEVMIRVNSNLDGMNEGLTSSGSLIKKMWRRETRNKLVIVSVAIFFIFIFVTIILMKISSGSEAISKPQRQTNVDSIKNEYNVSNSDIQESKATEVETSEKNNTTKTESNSQKSQLETDNKKDISNRKYDDFLQSDFSELSYDKIKGNGA